MLEYLLYTIIWLIGVGCFAFIMKVSTNKGQWLDILLGWQNKLEYHFRMRDKGVRHQLIYKWMGGCELCFVNIIVTLSFIPYVILSEALSNCPTAYINNIIGKVIVAIGWYFVYSGLGVVIGIKILYFTKPKPVNIQTQHETEIKEPKIINKDAL